MFKNIIIIGVLLATSVCHASDEISWWTISAGKDHVIEFLSEDINLNCHNGCKAYTVAGRSDEIFLSSLGENILTGLRQGKLKMSYSPNIYVLNQKSRAVTLIELDRFLKLDIIFEHFPVHGYEEHQEIEYGGNPEGHDYVAPIQRKNKEFIATLSSTKETLEKTTFGIPGIIPFFGRSKWFQKEESHKGTFFLEVFDKENPSKPVVQLQKKFNDLWLLPSIFEMASWTQGAKEPFLVVVDHENPITKGRGRILVLQLH